MAEVIRSELDRDHTYRVVRTERGHLVTARTRNELGMLLPNEWLHRTEEAALACLDAAMAFNAYWQAITMGYPVEALERKLGHLMARHKELCERLDDVPLIGQEVKALRAQHEEP